MVSRAIILAFACIAAANADVSELPKKPIILGGSQEFADVPFGVNPFGKNANVRPLPRPASPAPAVTPAIASPRISAQPRSLTPQTSALQAPRPFKSVSPRFQSQPIIAARPPPPRALPLVDRSLVNDINAQILRQEQEINSDGSYHFSFETDNGITREETGTPKVLGGNPPVVAEQVQGSYSYIENGVPIQVTYIADENGFRAFGDHLPTPPPTPPHVLRLLEFLAKSANNN